MVDLDDATFLVGAGFVLTFSVLIGYIILAGCMTILLPVLMLRLLLAYIELVNKIISSSPFFVVGSLFVDTIDMISTEINEGGRLIAVTAVGWGRLTCQGASSLILTVAQLLWSLALFCLHHPLIANLSLSLSLFPANQTLALTAP